MFIHSCVSVRDEDKRELEEQLARAKEAKLTTERERDLAVLQERLLEEEVQRTAEVTRNETRMTAVERMGYTEDIERSANKTIECLERWGFSSEQILEYMRIMRRSDEVASRRATIVHVTEEDAIYETVDFTKRLP